MATDWPGRKGQICSYPAHEGLTKRINHSRRVNAGKSAEIFAAFDVVVPIGAGLSILAFCFSFQREQLISMRTAITFFQVRELITLQRYFGAILVI